MKKFQQGNHVRETKFGEPSKEFLALPYSPYLPTSKVELLKLRVYIRERCLEDLEFRDMIYQMCSQDLVFFIQIFLFFHETREIGNEVGKFPALLWADQKDILAWFQEAIGITDITVEKTRGIGLSYLICCTFLWLWLFRANSIDLAMISKDEASLDQLKRPSTLLGKIDLMLENLPQWMTHTSGGKSICKRTATQHKFVNLLNGNAILGFVPTSDKLRSGRYYAIAIDEGAFLDNDDQRFLASSQHTSPSRVWISTHNGTGTFFYRATRDEVSDLLRISTWWWENEYCRAGLYKVEKGRVVILDEEYYEEVKDYPFVHDYPGYLRSPWLDRAFRKTGATKESIFEELFGIAALQHRKLFRPGVIDVARSTVTPPLFIGEVTKEGEWIEDIDAHWRLWQSPDTLSGVYAIGADPSIGIVGGDYAGFAAIDIKTGLLVLTARLPQTNQIDFAQLSVGACRLLAGSRGQGFARLNFESTGIGAPYTAEIKRLRYAAVYKENPKLERIGSHNQDRGASWLSELGRAISAGELVVKDSELVDEMECFEWDTDKLDIIYTSQDGHGDLAIAVALAWQCAKDRRRRFLKTVSDAYNLSGIPEIGPDAEPAVLERKKRANVWSSRFETV